VGKGVAEFNWQTMLTPGMSFKVAPHWLAFVNTRRKCWKEATIIMTTTNGIIHVTTFFTFFEEHDNMPQYKTVLTRNAQTILVVWLEQLNKSNRKTVL
jgi:hypothetical protein